MPRSARIVLISLAVVVSMSGLTACSSGGDGTETTAAPTARTALQSEATEPGEAAEPGADAPVETPTTTSPSFDPTQATGAVVGVPSETNTAPIVAVANYYTELPGFDLSVLEERQREQFLHRVNSEMCSCGCKNDTLARCLVNDQSCPLVKGMVQRVFDEVRSGS